MTRATLSPARSSEGPLRWYSAMFDDQVGEVSRSRMGGVNSKRPPTTRVVFGTP